METSNPGLIDLINALVDLGVLGFFILGGAYVWWILRRDRKNGSSSGNGRTNYSGDRSVGFWEERVKTIVSDTVGQAVLELKKDALAREETRLNRQTSSTESLHNLLSSLEDEVVTLRREVATLALKGGTK